jgi:signal transduction histidine kinase
MTRRLLVGYLAITVIVLLILEVPLAVFYSQRERERFTTAVERDASVLATIYEDSLEKGQPPNAAAAQQYAKRTGARVVVVDNDGIAEVDTAESVPRDFSTRPEIITALTGSRAVGTRSSATLHADLLYVAIPVASGGTIHGAVRVTLDTSDVDSQIHRFWLGLAAVAAVILAAMALVGLAIARSMTRPIRRLQGVATQFAGGDLSIDEQPLEGPVELQALARTMSTMAARLSELLTAQRAFVADASHQLRTPLTALRLRLENLQARASTADADELEAAIDETVRLGALVNDLLQLARADQSHVVEDTDLAAVTTGRVDMWAAVADAKDVRLELSGADQPVLVAAVPGALEQILDNVLDNAINATPSGSLVTVSVERGTAQHALRISDHGPGLSDDDKAHAVQRFWRGATGGSGTGLGLAIASALATASGGDLTLGDVPGHGLAVRLSLRPASSS